MKNCQCQPDCSSTKFEQFFTEPTGTSNYKKEATMACLHGLDSNILIMFGGFHSGYTSFKADIFRR